MQLARPDATVTVLRLALALWFSHPSASPPAWEMSWIFNPQANCVSVRTNNSPEQLGAFTAVSNLGWGCSSSFLIGGVQLNPAYLASDQMGCGSQ